MRRLRRFVRRIARAVRDVVNKVADAVADVVETIGNAIGRGLSWLGDRIPVVGGVLRWLGGVVSAVTDLIGSVIKAAGSIAGGIPSGLIRIVGGILTLDGQGILGGLGDILSGILGGVLVILGKVVALVQVIVTVGRPRPLNAIEKRLASLVFHRSIATYNVRVVDGNAGLFSLNDRPFVLGNTIYMKGKNAINNPELFVHECVHVWQNQHLGSHYTAEALASQWWGAGYDWEREANRGRDWVDFELEAQGKFIEDAYLVGGTISGAGGNGAFFAEDNETQRVFVFNAVDWTGIANEATRILRGQTPWRLSILLV